MITNDFTCKNWNNLNCQQLLQPCLKPLWNLFFMFGMFNFNIFPFSVHILFFFASTHTRRANEVRERERFQCFNKHHHALTISNTNTFAPTYDYGVRFVFEYKIYCDLKDVLGSAAFTQRPSCRCRFSLLQHIVCVAPHFNQIVRVSHIFHFKERKLQLLRPEKTLLIPGPASWVSTGDKRLEFPRGNKENYAKSKIFWKFSVRRLGATFIFESSFRAIIWRKCEKI